MVNGDVDLLTGVAGRRSVDDCAAFSARLLSREAADLQLLLWYFGPVAGTRLVQPGRAQGRSPELDILSINIPLC